MADPIISPQASYKNTGNLIRSVADEVAFIGAGEIPFLSYISGTTVDITGGKQKTFPKLDNLPKTMMSVRGATFEWYEKDQVVTQLTSTGNITNSATTLNVTPSAHAGYLTKGQIILWGSEQLYVTANGDINTGAVTVQRAFAGTTAVAHTSAPNDIQLLGKASIEGDTVTIDPYIPPTAYYNNWLGMPVSFGETFIESAIGRYGKDKNWKDDAITDCLRRAVVGLERMAVYGLRSNASASVASSFGGMTQFTSSQTGLSGATLTTEHINTVLRTAYDAGGINGCPDSILTNSYGKTTLSKLYGNNYANITRQEDERTGGYVVDMIRTDFGDLKVIMSPYVNLTAKELWFFRRENISIGPLKNNGVDLSFAAYEKALVGTGYEGFLYGVYTMCFKKNSSRALLSAFVSP